MRRNRIGLLLLAVIAASLVPMGLVYAQNESESRALNFIRLAEMAKEKTLELQSMVEGEGITIPDEIIDLIDEADQKLTEAGETMDVALAEDAMKLYRRAYGLLSDLLTDEEYEDVFSLRIAIERAYQCIDRLEGIADQIGDDDEISAEVETYLNWVAGNLSLAKDNLTEAVDTLELDPADIELANENLTEAKGNISDAFAALKLVAGWTTQWRMENYVRNVLRFRERIRMRLDDAKRQGADTSELLEDLGYVDEDGDGDIDTEDYLVAIQNQINGARQQVIREASRRLKGIRQEILEVHHRIIQQRKGR